MGDLGNNVVKGKPTYKNRWHNHLNPDVEKKPLTAEEEKIIFDAQKTYGNKWSEIARMLKGRTDNIIKNHFYSTLRREIRELLRRIKKDDSAEPTEVNIKYMREIIKENNIDYKQINNVNVRNLLIYLDEQDSTINSSPKIINKTSNSDHYSL